jgi:Transglycosylase SLT domain
MTALTPAAAMALALQCVPPSVAPIMVGIAQHESGLDPVAIHRDANGTVDVGLAQVNSANFAWLGLTLETALDPCRNLAAGARVLLAKYNGNPPDAAKAAYATAVTARIRDLGDAPSAAPLLPPDPPVIYAKPAKHAGRDLVYGN